jgi:putative transposase
MVESFIGRFRDKCLNEGVFASLAEASAVVERWRLDYNQVHPHSAHRPRHLTWRISGLRAPGCPTLTSSGGRPLPSSHRSRYEQPGLSIASPQPQSFQQNPTSHGPLKPRRIARKSVPDNI